MKLIWPWPLHISKVDITSGLFVILSWFTFLHYCCCRCANCFDCPCCMHTLSTRATNIPAPLPDDPTKTAMKKAYYLACGFCRWTSRDVGMADKSVGGCWSVLYGTCDYAHVERLFSLILFLFIAASGGWQEPENCHNQRVCPPPPFPVGSHLHCLGLITCFEMLNRCLWQDPWNSQQLISVALYSSTCVVEHNLLYD